MRYYYERFNANLYKCDHPLYNACTLYTDSGKGLAVVQLRYNSKLKLAMWSGIDEYLVYDIANRDGFAEYFDANSGPPSQNGLYPTVSVRTLMWALKIKPLRKNTWERGFQNDS